MVKRLPARPVRWPEPVAPRRRGRRARRLRLHRRAPRRRRLSEVADDVGHQPVARRRLVRQHVELVDHERALRGQDQPRASFVDMAVADVLDQPPAPSIPCGSTRISVSGRSITSRCGRAQQEPFRIGLAVELHDDAHALRVAGHLVVVRLERRGGGGRQHAEQAGRATSTTSAHRTAARDLECRLPNDSSRHLPRCRRLSSGGRAPRHD